ncbi:hypothetical protein ACH4UM_18660 [Streptomyces sp. NPDC020801]|uniref:hypothetical protein n=1 Tax=Streptomyces sp. NPDC020801 TaxID=3365093 RepID=UPI0037A0880B
MIGVVVGGLLGFAFVAAVWQVRRALSRPGPDVASEWDLAEATAAERPGQPPVINSEPGINLALQDECELLWSMPAYGTAADPTTTTTEGD